MIPSYPQKYYQGITFSCILLTYQVLLALDVFNSIMIPTRKFLSKSTDCLKTIDVISKIKPIMSLLGMLMGCNIYKGVEYRKKSKYQIMGIKVISISRNNGYYWIFFVKIFDYTEKKNIHNVKKKWRIIRPMLKSRRFLHVAPQNQITNTYLHFFFLCLKDVFEIFLFLRQVIDTVHRVSVWFRAQEILKRKLKYIECELKFFLILGRTEDFLTKDYIF